MKVIYLNKDKNIDLLPSCGAIGFFDGLHLGHKQLLDKVNCITATNNLKKAFITFDKHPKEIISDQNFKYLLSLDQKINIIQEYGFDYFLVIEFDEKTSKVTPDQFVKDYLIDNNIKEVVCGFDFRYGYLGKGSYHSLKEYPDNFNVNVIDKYDYNHKKVSSSIIRSLLNEGNVSLANYLMTRSYSIVGEVIHGRQNGRKLGFPTANVDTTNYVLLKKGVYSCYVYVDGRKYQGMANIGYNPTLGTLDHLSLEVNIFDFDEDIYGETIRVDFINRIRKETKFSNIEKLIEQLNQDKELIKQQL